MSVSVWSLSPYNLAFLDKHHENICRIALAFVLGIVRTLKQTMSKHGKPKVVRNPVSKSEKMECEVCKISRTNCGAVNPIDFVQCICVVVVVFFYS